MLKKLFGNNNAKIENNNKDNTQSNTKPIVINSDQKSELPKISIKSVLAALQNEELDDLIPLYAAFLKRDLHLSSEMRKRRRQILSMRLAVESKDEALKEFIKGYLNQIDRAKLEFDLSLGIPYGFSIINMVYDTIYISGKAYFAPKTFLPIHPRYTTYDSKERKLYIKLTSGNKIEPCQHSEQFIYHEHPEDTGELVDYGAMSNILLTCVMKHAVMNCNMQYFEMLGVPPIYVNSNVADEKEAANLVDQVLNLRSNSVGVFPKDTLVNLLLGQAGRTEFLSFIQYCDQQVSHNLMGNTLSGNKDSTGSFALGVVHDDRRKDVLTYDCIMIERTLKKLIDRVVAMNYPGKAEYEVYYDTGDERDEARLADIYSKLTAAGYEIPVEHIEEMFNISGIRRKVTTPSNNYGFNSRRTERNSKQQIIDIEAQAEALPTKVIEDEIYTFIENAMKNATTYQEAIDALLEAYPNANFEKATDMMEKIATNAYVLGRTE